MKSNTIEGKLVSETERMDRPGIVGKGMYDWIKLRLFTITKKKLLFVQVEFNVDNFWLIDKLNLRVREYEIVAEG